METHLYVSSLHKAFITTRHPNRSILKRNLYKIVGAINDGQAGVAGRTSNGGGDGARVVQSEVEAVKARTSQLKAFISNAGTSR